MKKGVRTTTILGTIIIIFILVWRFFIYKSYPFLAEYIMIAFWTVLALIIFILNGLPKDRKYYKNISTRYIIISLLSYLLLIYLLGLFTGFSYSVFSFSLKSILKNIFPAFIIIVSKELVRYITFKKCGNEIKPIIFFTIIYIFLEILIITTGYSFDSLEQIFIFIFRWCLPIVAREMLYSYLSYNISILPTLILRISFELTPFLLPIYPDLGNFIESALGVLFPFIIYFNINKILRSNSKETINHKKTFVNLFLIPIIAILTCIIILVSGIFSYQMIAIGSDSMNPVYYKGDAIIYKKTNAEDVKIGDILTFSNSGILVTHRVINIKEESGKLYFETKGDNNNAVDPVLINEENVVGIVKYVVKYVGYPTTYLKEIFNRQ